MLRPDQLTFKDKYPCYTMKNIICFLIIWVNITEGLLAQDCDCKTATDIRKQQRSNDRFDLPAALNALQKEINMSIFQGQKQQQTMQHGQMAIRCTSLDHVAMPAWIETRRLVATNVPSEQKVTMMDHFKS